MEKTPLEKNELLINRFDDQNVTHLQKYLTGTI